METRTSIARTTEKEGSLAGQILGEELRNGLGGDPPDAVIVFASPVYDYTAVLDSLASALLTGGTYQLFGGGAGDDALKIA